MAWNSYIGAFGSSSGAQISCSGACSSSSRACISSSGQRLQSLEAPEALSFTWGLAFSPSSATTLPHINYAWSYIPSGVRQVQHLDIAKIRGVTGHFHVKISHDLVFFRTTKFLWGLGLDLLLTTPKLWTHLTGQSLHQHLLDLIVHQHYELTEVHLPIVIHLHFSHYCIHLETKLMK